MQDREQKIFLAGATYLLKLRTVDNAFYSEGSQISVKIDFVENNTALFRKAAISYISAAVKESDRRKETDSWESKFVKQLQCTNLEVALFFLCWCVHELCVRASLSLSLSGFVSFLRKCRCGHVLMCDLCMRVLCIAG